MSRIKPKAQYMILGPYPYNLIYHQIKTLIGFWYRQMIKLQIFYSIIKNFTS